MQHCNTKLSVRMLLTWWLPYLQLASHFWRLTMNTRCRHEYEVRLKIVQRYTRGRNSTYGGWRIHCLPRCPKPWRERGWCCERQCRARCRSSLVCSRGGEARSSGPARGSRCRNPAPPPCVARWRWSNASPCPQTPWNTSPRTPRSRCCIGSLHVWVVRPPLQLDPRGVAANKGAYGTHIICLSSNPLYLSSRARGRSQW